MKKDNFLSASGFVLSCASLTLLLLTLPGCATPNIVLPKPPPAIVKEYKHVTLFGNSPGMKDTGVYLEKGNAYSILATGSIDLWSRGAPPGFKYHDVRPELGWSLIMRVGTFVRFYPFFSSIASGTNGISRVSDRSGNIYLGIQDGPVSGYGEPRKPDNYRDNTGAFSVDIIV